MHLTKTLRPLRLTALAAVSSAVLIAGHAQSNPGSNHTQGNAATQQNRAAGQTTDTQSVTRQNATGQNQSAQGEQIPRAPGDAGALDRRASELIGMSVHNPQGQDLGSINDLMIDVNNQRVRYAILGFGGFMGMGEKLFAYPVDALQTSGNRLLLDVPQERLEQAPGFERNRWPDWIDTSYRDRVDRHFSQGGSGAENLPNVRLVRASELMDMDVKDPQGRDAGEIEDLVVNLGTGEVRYAVLDFDSSWGVEDKLLPLPLNTMRMPTGNSDDAVLQVPRERLSTASGFDENQWPELNNAQYRERVDRDLERYAEWTQRPEGSGRSPAQARPQDQQSQQQR